MASLAQLKVNSVIAIMMTLGIFFVFLGILSLFGGLYLGVDPGVCGVLLIPMVIIFAVIQILIGPSVVKWATGVRILKSGENEFLEKTVMELCQKARIPVPRIGIVENPAPNAFVFGNTKGSTVLAVHSGLLNVLNKDEIRAVLGHEIGHIRHGDCLTMTFLSVIPLIASYVAIGILYSRGGRGKGGGYMILIALVAGLVYLSTSLLIKWLSRLREFYADSYSALITDPAALASALTKITYGLSLSDPKFENKGVQSFYVNDAHTAEADMAALRKGNYDLDGDGVLDENELEKAMSDEANSGWRKVSGLFASHPPTYKRILNLKALEREMKGGTRILDEKQVFEKVEF